MYQKSQNIGLEREDFFDWLLDAIEYACKYRAWQSTEKRVNAQSCINQCIETIRLQKYYEFNLDKHKLNYNIMSLDAPVDDSSDEAAVTLAAKIAKAPDQLEVDSMQTAIAFVQHYINKKKLVEAIILDTIAFNDVEKHKKKLIKTKTAPDQVYKYPELTSEFWPFKLVQLLGELPENYLNYFTDKYEVSTESAQIALDSIKQANNQKLYRYLRATLQDAKNHASVLLA